MSRKMELIDEIFAKSNTGDLTPEDIEDIVFLSEGLDFTEQWQVGMIFEGIAQIDRDKTNKVFNP